MLCWHDLRACLKCGQPTTRGRKMCQTPLTSFSISRIINKGRLHQNSGRSLPPRSTFPSEQLTKLLRRRPRKERGQILYGNMAQEVPHTTGRLQNTSRTGEKKGCIRWWKSMRLILIGEPGGRSAHEFWRLQLSVGKCRPGVGGRASFSTTPDGLLSQLALHLCTGIRYFTSDFRRRWSGRQRCWVVCLLASGKCVECQSWWLSWRCHSVSDVNHFVLIGPCQWVVRRCSCLAVWVALSWFHHTLVRDWWILVISKSAKDMNMAKHITHNKIKRV